MKRRDFIKSLSAGIVSPFLVDVFRYKKEAQEYVTPYLEPPENVVPGVANWYSSVCRQCSAGCGIQVKIREGRAKKIEGNPSFPINKGKICARGQAGLQVLYNPDRIKQPLVRKSRDGEFTAISWDKAISLLSDQLKVNRSKGGNNQTAFLTQPLRGNLGKLIKSFMSKYGSESLYSYEFLNDESLKKANELCFGLEAVPDYDIGNSKYILSFGAGFLDSWISPVKHSVGYGEMRDVNHGIEGNRGWLVQFEPRLSLTGANADEWFPVVPESEGLLALSIAHVIVNEELHDPSVNHEISEWQEVLEKYDPEKVADKTGVSAEEIDKIARSFATNRPSLAVCGNPATAQANGTLNAVAANILNYLVGNIGKKGGVRFNAQASFSDGIENELSFKGINELIGKMESGLIDVLMLYNTNPVFNVPQSTGLSKVIKQVPFVVSFSSFMDESTVLADLILPDHSYLESWGDYIPITDNGRRTIGVMQPVTEPVFDTRQIGDVFISLAKSIDSKFASAFPWNSYYDYLKEAWTNFYNAGKKHVAISENDFEEFWENLLKNGGYWDDAESFISPKKSPVPDIISKASFNEEHLTKETFYFHLYPSNKLYDGRGANQPWLQQLPEPLITATWGSWVEINPEVAKEMNIKEGDVVQIETSDGKLKVPAYLYPAIEPHTIAMPVGQGHTAYGRYARNRGENPMQILNSVPDGLSGSLAWNSTRVSISKTGESLDIIKTEPNVAEPGLEEGLREMEREIVQWIDPKELEKETGEELEPIKALPSRDLQKAPHFLAFFGLGKYRESKFHEYKYRWGMVIDLDKCTGCSSCMVACYAENNLPIVSPIEMSRRRHKNWMRIDRYWEGEYPKIRAKQMPVNCAQCGNAPCESVCPVYDTYHTKDGLNAMVYQRCIGCRYCNANCPYRSRMFNWFNPEWPKPLEQQLSPELSVRTAGIAEKCTFCVQRIRHAKGKAKDEERDVKDGEITPACAQTCPTGAITFGNLMDSESKVSTLARNPRRYRLLEEFNHEPAVVYLKAVRTGAESEHEAGAETEAESETESEHG